MMRNSRDTSPTRPRHRSRPTLDRLEDRTLLSADTGWVFGVGGPSYDGATNTAVDKSGNVYVSGYFTGMVDFDPADTARANPAAILTSGAAGADRDTFVAKYAPTGAFVWARDVLVSDSGSSVSAPHGIAFSQDPAGVQSLYLTGSFRGTATFTGGTVRTSAGQNDIFVTKLDAGDGHLIWVDTWGSTDYDWGRAVAVDADGYAYATGSFSGTVAFGPSLSLTSAGAGDVFVVKLDPGDGHAVWAKGEGGAGDDTGSGITIAQDPVTRARSVYLTGAFSAATAAFGPSVSLPNAGLSDIFIAKLAATDGTTQWAEAIGGPVWDGGSGIAVDGAGNIYATGSFNNPTANNPSANYPVDFDPGPGTMYLTSTGGIAAYVMKLDPSGHLLWARSLGGGVGVSIAVDGGGNVYTGGAFSGSIDFDPGPGSFPLTSAGDGGGFVSELDPSGNFVAAWQLGVANYIGITTYQDPVTLSQSIIAVGSYQGTADYPTGSSLTSAGSYDAFVMRLSPQLGAIAGNVFNDLNDNGANDEAAPLKGWTAFLDQNQNGVLDPGEASTVTDSQGNYVFSNLALGTYDFAVVGQPGYTQTAPAAGQAGTYTGTSNGQVGRTITLGTAQFADRLDFGEYTPNQVKTYSASPSLRLASSRTTISTVTIADSYAIYDLNVQLNITQVNDSALQSVALTAPDGTVVPHFASVGGTGSNFTNTTLDDAAATPIGSGVAPFTGTFRPQSLLDVLDGKNLHGTWTLSLTEGSSTGKNVLNSWSLIVTGPKPPGAAMSMRLTAAGGAGSLSGFRSFSNPVAPGTAIFDQALGMANPDLASDPTAPDVALGDVGLPLARPRVRWSLRLRPFGQP